MVEHWSPKPGVGSSSLSTRANFLETMNNFIQYIKDSFEELNTNMTWISREEAQKSTVVVAVFTIIFALAVAVIDKVFQTGLDNFFKLF
ncbi:preprotein translocase subunit SecE [Tenacibaculum sp. 190524A05c]|uniref:Preprotein translocase subunit SecE n=2 Tax=Tenacibaculum platacis TaxID=3137852 RepID=A0ABM9P487_9FLAO